MKTTIAFLTLALSAFSNFAAEPGATLAAAKEKVAPCCRVNVPTTKPTDRSLYLLESRWTSDRGAQVALSVLKGRPQIVAMFFTQCEYACPVIVNDMKKLQAKLPPALRDGVDFLLVSMDPERDTAAALAE